MTKQQDHLKPQMTAKTNLTLKLKLHLRTPKATGKTSKSKRHNRKMSKLKDYVFTNLDAINPSTAISSELKSRIEQQLYGFFPKFRTPTHPPYASMIERAIRGLKEDEGASEGAISEFIKREYKGLPWGHESFLSHHLRKLCGTGDIVRENNGNYCMTLVQNCESKDMLEIWSTKSSGDEQCGVEDKDWSVEQGIVVSSMFQKQVIEERSQPEVPQFEVFQEPNDSEMQLIEWREIEEQYKEGEPLSGVTEEHQLQGQQPELIEDSKLERNGREEEQAHDEQSTLKRCHDPNCEVELGNPKENMVKMQRGLQQLPRDKQGEDQALSTTLNLEHDYSLLPFKEMCMESIKRTERFKEQLLEYSLSLRGMEVPKDGNLGSMMEVEGMESVGEQRQLLEWDDRVIGKQCQPQDLRIDSRTKKLGFCPDSEGEGDGVVNLSVPFSTSSLPVLADKKQGERLRRKRPLDQRDYLIVCGLFAQRQPKPTKIRGRPCNVKPKKNISARLETRIDPQHQPELS